MSVTEQEVDQSAPASARSQTAAPGWQRALVIGTGFGIAIGERNLEATIVRARPSGAALVAVTTIADFRNRPAVEWGAELRAFLEAAHERQLAATVLLPRSEVIVRTLMLPGVTDKDAANAIELQLDSLHPWNYGGSDVEVAWGWSRVGRDDLIVGLARKEVLNSWETLFAEAGISMAAATFSAAVIHAALRVWSAAPASFLCFNTDEAGRTEVYGESESRPVFSAEFSGAPERAFALSRAELRMSPYRAAVPLPEVLPFSADESTAPSALAWAAAIAGSVPRVAKFANLLPPERRASHDRLQYVVPAILGTILLIGLLAVFVIFPAVEQKRYRADLDRAARQLEPSVLRAQRLQKTIETDRQRIAALDQFRARPQADLEVLNELTRLLPPPVWTSAVEIYPDSVIITGEAEQAAPLLKILDSSPLFQNSEFALTVARSGQGEQFRIKAMRRGRIGRTTP